MTTLIIHPNLDVQRKNALNLAGKLLSIELTPNLSTYPPDLHLLDGTEVSSIGIDEVRELIRKLQYHPYDASVQIGLIVMANMLTEQAQNSLLKTLEEPTPQTEFILTTPHEKFLLPTILSRSQITYVSEKFEISTTKAATADSPFTLDDFFEKDLVDKFLAVEELVKLEKDAPGSVHAFLAELITHYRHELLEATRNGDAKDRELKAKHVRNINRAVHFISKNANKRLTIENLILQLEPSIMHRRH